VFSPAPVTCRPNTTLQFGQNDWKSSALRVELESPTWRGAHAPTVPPRRQPEVGEPPPPSSAPSRAKGKRRKRGDAALRPARSALDMEPPLPSLRGRRSAPVCSLAPVEERAPPSTAPDLRLCSTAALGDSVRRSVPGNSAVGPPWLTSMDAAVDEEGGRRCGRDLRMQRSSVAEEPRRWRAARRRSSPCGHRPWRLCVAKIRACSRVSIGMEAAGRRRERDLGRRR
jgi:hypothetical protein